MAPVKKKSYAISTHGRWRMARYGHIRTVKAKKKNYARMGIMGLLTTGKQTNAYFHCLQGAAFPQICGRLTAEQDQWDHKTNDRDDPAYMYARSLRPANRSEQALNKTTSDNWIEGRPYGTEAPWKRFQNPRRAATVDLRKLEPGKNWDKGSIWQVLEGRCNQHQGWEFRYVDASKAVRIAKPEPPQLDGETWRTLVLPGGEVVRPCKVSDQGRYRNSRKRTFTPTPARGQEYARIGVRDRYHRFHNVVMATFEDVVGKKPGDEYTAGHKDMDSSNNRVSNLGWEDRSTQALNKTTSDNWIEGRPYGTEAPWTRFRNPGQAATVDLRKLEPGKNWDQGGINMVLSGRCNHHMGWEFRYVDAAKAVRHVTSAPTEPQWRDEPEFADEQWARLEPLGDWRLRVTPEYRDGTDGNPFEVNLHEFHGPSDSDSSDEEEIHARL